MDRLYSKDTADLFEDPGPCKTCERVRTPPCFYCRSTRTPEEIRASIQAGIGNAMTGKQEITLTKEQTFEQERLRLATKRKRKRFS